ncbi:MAG: alpha/beta hydrolase [Bryobacterales bacterium]|nr:alpha/beta hydrolase [Bryobacterales bacterium]
MQTGFVEVDGQRLRYQRGGSGPDVLLLHGWGGQIESFYPVVQALNPTFRTTAIDFPGHGQSALPPAPWHVSDFLNCTLRVMDQLGLRRPHIVAHSFGGRVTIKMAAEHPQRAGKLLFTAGAGVIPPASLSVKAKRFAANFKALVPENVREKLLPHLASRDYQNAGELRPTLRNVVSEDLTPLLSKIAHKTLLVWGDQDRETPLYCGETMKREMPNAELVVFPGAGHFPYLDQTNKFNLLMLKFLRED